VLRAQTARDFSDETEQRPEVRRVRIVGTKALGRDDVADALATKASGCLSLVFRPFCLFTRSPYVYERRYLDREEFQRDVVRLLVFYYKRGWRDAQVDTTVARAGRNAVNVTFTVREGPPTRTARVTVEDPTDRLRPRDRARLLAPAPASRSTRSASTRPCCACARRTSTAATATPRWAPPCSRSTTRPTRPPRASRRSRGR
jgi:hypothetical protein